MNSNLLLEPVKIGKWHLRSRVVMAPMTRSFADDTTGEVGSNIVEYYRKRAADGIGLIITEGINPSRRAKGTFGIPGLYTKNQIESWKRVTDAVHQEGGMIVAQLWHVGRLTHHELTGGLPPQAPSPIRANGLVHRLRKPYEIPEEMSWMDIQNAMDQFAQAAQNALIAGFDGVEIHAAHGYLIDQFNTDITNTRSDQYGGDQSKRLTFMKELLTSVIHEIGPERTIVRFSEIKDDIPEFKWNDPEKSLSAFIQVFKEVGLSILHPSTNQFRETMVNQLTFHQLVRKHWDGIIIGVGNLDSDTASQAINEGTIDVAAFGRPILANPDFMHRLKNKLPMESFQPSDLNHLI
ncbi:oxidoreductase [Shimazuella kribbensis]|uniref:oxidoreductase n=1 Tax=Shimazuella kribbensis TaxID=139808 RepID=UPI000422C545|nr:oxidoreductase [Shimazuella kribbensis]